MSRSQPVSIEQVRKNLLAQSILRHLRYHESLTDDILATLCKVPLNEATEARRRLRGHGLVCRGKVHIIGSRDGKTVGGVAWRLAR